MNQAKNILPQKKVYTLRARLYVIYTNIHNYMPLVGEKKERPTSQKKISKRTFCPTKAIISLVKTCSISLYIRATQITSAV